MAPKRRCEHRNDDGSRCEAPSSFVDPDTGLCPSHSPNASERLSEAGKKGAETQHRQRRDGGLQEEDLPPLESADAAEVWCDQVGRAVVVGRIGHNEAKAALRAVREWRESHDAGKVSERLNRLTDALAEWRETGDPTPVLEVVD